MKNELTLCYILLLILTIATAYIFEWFGFFDFAAPLIMVFAVIKFLLVAFQFMELKKGHLFWKISLTFTMVLFVLLIVLIK